MTDDVLGYMDVELVDYPSSFTQGTVVVCARAGDSDAPVRRVDLP